MMMKVNNEEEFSFVYDLQNECQACCLREGPIPKCNKMVAMVNIIPAKHPVRGVFSEFPFALTKVGGQR